MRVSSSADRTACCGSSTKSPCTSRQRFLNSPACSLDSVAFAGGAVLVAVVTAGLSVVVSAVDGPAVVGGAGPAVAVPTPYGVPVVPLLHPLPEPVALVQPAAWAAACGVALSGDGRGGGSGGLTSPPFPGGWGADPR